MPIYGRLQKRENHYSLLLLQNAVASALGVAHLVGLATGFWPDLATLSRLFNRDEEIAPRGSQSERELQIGLYGERPIYRAIV